MTRVKIEPIHPELRRIANEALKNVEKQAAQVRAKRVDGTFGTWRLHLGSCKVLARAPYKGSVVVRRGDGLVFESSGVPLHRWEVGTPCRSCKVSYDKQSSTPKGER